MKLDKPTFAVSTRADNLAKALRTSQKTITIWVRAGKYKNRFPLLRTTVTYNAKSVIDAGNYQKRFIATLPVAKTHTKLSILKEISNDEIRQLLAFTKRDKTIRSSTHDFDSFKSKKSFLSWKKRGKYIYTLINKNGRLTGIVWFNKGVPTVRIYPHSSKAKTLAKKLLVIVCKDFEKNNRKLTVSKNRLGQAFRIMS
ncbi:MAG: hypothetical protein ABSE04_03160 [Candidatus Microgenomates bacterium]|jgi:hypothetical protein